MLELTPEMDGLRAIVHVSAATKLLTVPQPEFLLVEARISVILNLAYLGNAGSAQHGLMFS